MIKFIQFLFFIIVSPYSVGASLPIDKLKLPQGFSIEIYADKVPNARQMTLGDKGTLFVGTRTPDVVYAINTKGQVKIIAKGLDSPNGVAFKDGNLYVAEISRVIRFDNIESLLDKPPKPKVIYDQFPSDRGHGWKYIAFGPDGYLYVPVGTPCNVCLKKDPRYASIMRMKPDGKALEIYAEGVRNTVGFDWDPRTRELWFTDNGRDWMGDDMPPDELNHAPRPGMHFGYPFIHGKSISDPKFGKQKPKREYSAPAYELPAHVAALGMSFYTGKMFPDKYRNQIIIPEHGSWNRSKKSGYKLSLVTLKNNKAASYSDFVTGWLQGEKAWGRPVDTLVMPDGSLLVSDDKAGVIYRITYSKKERKI